LPRPSSATNAKASAMHPLYLDTFTYISTQFDVLHQQNFMSKNRYTTKLQNYKTTKFKIQKSKFKKLKSKI
jgi:hypothetical protein